MFLDFCLRYLVFERFKEAAQLPGAINCNNFNSLIPSCFYFFFFSLFCALVASQNSWLNSVIERMVTQVCGSAGRGDGWGWWERGKKETNLNFTWTSQNSDLKIWKRSQRGSSREGLNVNFHLLFSRKHFGGINRNKKGCKLWEPFKKRKLCAPSF